MQTKKGKNKKFKNKRKAPGRRWQPCVSCGGGGGRQLCSLPDAGRVRELGKVGPLVQFEGAQAVICGGRWEVDRGERTHRRPGALTPTPGAGKGTWGPGKGCRWREPPASGPSVRPTPPRLWPYTLV